MARSRWGIVLVDVDHGVERLGRGSGEEELLAEMPFPIKAIQVDGGSEFMADFEAACAERGLRLYVLPPKCPQLNGAVERAQPTWRYEFYAHTHCPTASPRSRRSIDSLAHLYNH